MLNNARIAPSDALVPILFSAILTFSFPLSAFSQAKPNFLFVIGEDMGMQIGLTETPEAQTPVIDSLAESGVFFNQAFTTCPTCSPAKASIMTGHYPHNHNLRINVYEFFGPSPNLEETQSDFNEKLAIPDQMPTLIEKLHAGGYRTGIMKKFHLSPHDKFPFDAWIRLNSSMEIARFIRESGDTPWLLLIGCDVTHRPFQNLQEGENHDFTRLEIPGHLPSTEVVKKDWAEYLKAIHTMDTKVGEIIQTLEQSGVKDNTIVIFTSDHGPAYHRAKFSPYDLGLHIPLIFSGTEPWIKQQGNSISKLVSTVDLMPTILDYADIEIPTELQGKSLRNLLEGNPGVTGHEYIFGEVHHGSPDPAIALQERSVFDGRYRLVFRSHLNRRFMKVEDLRDPIVWQNSVYEETLRRQDDYPAEYKFLAERDSNEPARARSFELYETNTDPWEINDLYGNPEYDSISIGLVQQLREWVIETDDRYVDTNALELELKKLHGDGASTCFLTTLTQ